MESIDEILGANIVRERTARGLTQAELGKKLKVKGLTVYRWESGKSWPNAENVEALAKEFGIPSWSLYVPQKPEKATKAKAEPDSRVRDALVLICRELGFNLASALRSKR